MTSSLSSGIDIFLQPGEWYFGDAHTRIHTTLGSCIAITLWHPRLKLGGMCHYMLPRTPNPEKALNARYGDDAMQLMETEVRRMNTALSDYEAKLFGGASMFDVGPGGSNVANRNVEAAESLMRLYELDPIARSLGGCTYRRLVFDIANGEVWVRQGDNHQNEQLRSRPGAVA